MKFIVVKGYQISGSISELYEHFSTKLICCFIFKETASPSATTEIVVSSRISTTISVSRVIATVFVLGPFSTHSQIG